MNDGLQLDDPAAIGRQARIVFYALAGGVAMFAVVAFALNGSGALPLRAEGFLEGRLALWIWLAVAVSAGLTVISFWRTRVDPILSGGAHAPAHGGPAARARRLLTTLIPCWALVEGPALLAFVFYVLGGDALVFGLGIAFAAVGFAVTAPKISWFDPGEHA